MSFNRIISAAERAKPQFSPVHGMPDPTSDLIEVLHECEAYFDNRADADCDQDGFIPNKEMTLLSAVREAISNAERHAVIVNNSHVHSVFQPILAAIAPPTTTL